MEPREEPGSARRPAGRNLSFTSTYLGNYLAVTREPVYSLMFLTPLLVLYEAYAFFVNFDKTYQIRNGADILVKEFFRLFGIENLFSMMMVMLIGILVVIGISVRKLNQPIRWPYFLLMWGESLGYAVLLGPVTQRLTGLFQRRFLGPELLESGQELSLKVLVSLGAGVYEELVFRVFLISALLYLLEKAVGLSPVNAAVTAVVLSSLIFSSFHYVGDYQWKFTWESFVYRAIAGMVLSGLYIARGLGITAWTHSLYDIYVLLETGR